MPLDVFRKAAALARAGRVLVEDESDQAVYFRVRGDHGDHLVRLTSRNTFSCTCVWGSLHGPKGAYCSHVLAALLHQARVAEELPEPLLAPTEAAPPEGLTPTD